MELRPNRAETLPALYRSILEIIGELERRGDRATAARARRSATLGYRIWDEASERRLTRLHADLVRATGGPRGDRAESPLGDGPSRSRTVPPVATPLTERAGG